MRSPTSGHEPLDLHQLDTWRIFRIMAEFVEGIEHLGDMGPAVAVFGSARLSEGHRYYELGRSVAKALAEKGFDIITGAGPGIMEAANRGAQEGGAHSVGVNIDLPFEQVPNSYIDELISFRYFFVRKLMFLKYSCGIVILPGGFGTMDELFETLTLMQTQRAKPMPVVITGTDYYAELWRWLKDTMLTTGCISPGDPSIPHMTDDVDEIISILSEGHSDELAENLRRRAEGE